MLKYLTNFLLFIGLFVTCVQGQNSNSISGKLKNNIGEPIPAASILIEGSNMGTSSLVDGSFSLNAGSINFPISIAISSIGYKTLKIKLFSLNDLTNLNDIVMEYKYELGNDVVVSASRVREKLILAPVTIERLSSKDIKLSPSSDYFGILTSLNGVDGVTSGYLFKSVTTRGFSSGGNERFNQRVDGMDNQSPGLNFSVSSICGITEVDVDNIELLNGASSALYGSGGTNGTLLVSSKSPFKYQGLSFQMKQGLNHFNSNRSGGPFPFADWAVRWGRKIGDNFAYKITAQYITLTDWLASDQRNYSRIPSATSPYGEIDPLNRNRLTDPNYDGINIYGDENVSTSGGGYNFDLGSVVSGILQNPPAELLQQLQIPAGSLPGQLGNIPIPVGIFNTLAKISAPFSRTGFTEEQILNGQTNNFKFNVGLYFKLSKKIYLDFVTNYGNGSSVYTASDRYGLRGFTMIQSKLELHTDNWFVRAYITAENSGNTYNASVASQLFNALWPVTTPNSSPAVLQDILNNVVTKGGNANWYNTALSGAIFPPIFTAGGTAYGTAIGGAYVGTYFGALGRGLTPAQAYQQALGAIYAGGANSPNNQGVVAAQNAITTFFSNQTNQLQLFNQGRALADANMPTGNIFNDPRFQYIINTSLSQGGARLSDQSQFRNLEYQYNFTDPLNLRRIKLDWIVGGSFRQNYISSNGTIFADSTTPITYLEGGIYTQVSKWFFDFWKITVSGRYDYQQNYAGRFTPRISMVFKVAKQHNIRVSAQTAYRFPTNQNQYVNIKTGAGINVIGGLPFIWDKYSLNSNPAYTSESWLAYRTSYLNGAPNINLLQQSKFTALKPESSISAEIGYKSVIAEKILIDAYYYISTFNNFITQTNIFQPTGTLANIWNQNLIFNIPVNSNVVVNTKGWGISVDYKAFSNFTIKANLYSDEINNLPSQYVSFFNTPKYRYNLGINNPTFLFRGVVGFNLNYRWQDKVKYESTFGTGIVPAFGTLDASVNVNLFEAKSVLKVGGTNISNNYYTNGFGGPSIGGLYYVSFGYNLF